MATRSKSAQLSCLVALAATCLSCATTRPERKTLFRCPAAGGPAWTEVRSEHFILRTDETPAEAQVLSRRLEESWSGLAAFLRPRETPTVRLRVIAFAGGEFRTFFSRNIAAVTVFGPGGALVAVGTGITPLTTVNVVGDPARAFMAQMARLRAELARAEVAHEVAHYRLAFELPLEPAWLVEGLAQYLETVRIENGEARLGEVSERQIARFERDRVGDLRELLAARQPPAGRHDVGRFYADSWLLVHHLASERATGFQEYLQRVARGDAPDAAWAGAFPDLASEAGLDGLRRTLNTYARRDRFTVLRTAAAIPSESREVRTLSAAEVHALRFELLLQGEVAEQARPQVEAELEEALREATSDPTAQELWARLAGYSTARLEVGQTVVTAHPEQARSWRLLGQALAEDPAGTAEAEAALRRALEIDDLDGDARGALAGFLLRAGRPGEALPVLRRWARDTPWAGAAWSGYIQALAALGRCGEARAMADQAGRRAFGVGEDGRARVPAPVRAMLDECRG